MTCSVPTADCHRIEGFVLKRPRCKAWIANAAVVATSPPPPVIADLSERASGLSCTFQCVPWRSLGFRVCTSQAGFICSCESWIDSDSLPKKQTSSQRRGRSTATQNKSNQQQCSHVGARCGMTCVWQALQFMDSVSRVEGLRLLIENALELPDRQFILLSPQVCTERACP